MTYSVPRLPLLGLLIALPVLGNDIIINEIMYLPSSRLEREEYIELYNRGTNNVSLQGWSLSRGVSFVFTNNITLAPGDYWVVVADLAAFQAKYPGINNVSGNWEGALANGGEEIEIEDPEGNNIDSVTYAEEGDWATRRRGPFVNGHRGWEWFAAHDGAGSSLELFNSRLSNNPGQNWAASTQPQGTPGVVNSVRSTDISPMILDVTHSPAIPSSADTVAVTCRIEDEEMPAVTATLFYRTTQGSFQSIPMLDNGQQQDGGIGDGLFGAILPAQFNGTIVEFYVMAVDGETARTWPAPALDENGIPGQFANALYQVDESIYIGLQPVLRLVMTAGEAAELASSTIRNTDAQMNATLISTDGTETQVRHNTGARIRGAGSRGAGNPVPNYRVNIPTDQRWKGVEAINLNSRYPYSQLVGNALATKAGLHAPNVRAVQVRVNGVNLAQSGSPQFNAYALVEVVNSDWAENHLPQDSEGNVYRGSTGNHSATLSFLNSTNPGTYTGSGYLKASNEAENDWRDMVRLTFVLSTNSDDATYVRDVTEIVNVPMWMRYFAFFSCMGSFETSLATGRGDDWIAYRGFEDPRFILVPHDLDSILGQGGGPNPDTLFRMMPQVNGGANTVVLNRFMRHPSFVHYYYRELKSAVDTLMAPEHIDPLLDRYLEDFVPQPTIDAMKQYAASRRGFILSQIPQTYSINTGLGFGDGYFQSFSTNLSLSGSANAIDIRRVLVNGVEANYVPWQGSWNLNNTALLPGLNRVVVQFLGDNDTEVLRNLVNVWYNDGTTTAISGTLAGDTIWTADAGPYVLSGTVTVPSGSTLTIQPGTTLFFGQNAGLSIQGRLLAEGTADRRIQMARQPGSGNTWAGLVFNNSTADNRLTFTDIEYAATADSIELNNSSLLVDHVTWSGTTRTILDLDNSSIIIRNSVFPTIADNETIHGTGMPANGYVIIQSNYFGGTTGYSDIIDFTGGQRPGPILQVYDNIFNGGSDDALDLDGTDAHIEGNHFLNIHQDAPRDSGSYAIATDTGADITVVRNLFYNNDHALLLKNGARATFHNNTVFHLRTNNAASYPAAAISFGEPDRNVGGGAGADLDGNIFWDIDQNLHFLFFTNGVMTLNVNHSILSGTNHPGVGNLSQSPQFQSTDTNLLTAFTLAVHLALRPGSPAIGTGPNGLDMGGLVPAGASISGEPLSPTASTAATLTVAGPGITHYRWQLNGGPWSQETPIATPIILSGLANGDYTVQAVGRNSAGALQPEAQATVSKTWTVNTSVAMLLINEVLARNARAFQHEDTFPDLIELYNPGPDSISLEGMGLTDIPDIPYQYEFPPGLSIGSGEYLLIYADNEDQTAGIHTRFGLNQDGDALYLFERLSAGGALLDSVVFGAQVADLSIGREASGQWRLCVPTPAGPNQVTGTGPPALLRINEWGAQGQTFYAEDFVELFNPDSAPVALAGLHMTDHLLGWPARHVVPPLSFVGAGGHVLFVADGNALGGALHLPFQLGSEQGELGLFDAQLGLIDCVLYGPQYLDVSQGLRPSGGTEISYFGSLTQTHPTPGGPNPGQGSSSTVTNILVPVFDMATDWNYNRDGFDLGTEWREPEFDDGFWPIGNALLGVENAFLPPPGLVTTFFNYNNNQIIYYFRKSFLVETNLEDFALQVSTVLDDGAVIYLNGQEVLRIRLPSGPISAFTQANTTVSDASTEIWTLPQGTVLNQGPNVIAVEVHQGNTPSSDVIWGMSLTATQTRTNFTSLSVALNEVMANNGTIQTPGDTNITDWAELYNPSDQEVDLSDMSLTDDTDEPRRWVFPTGSRIPARSYLVVRFDPDLPVSTNAVLPFNTGFGLSANDDSVHLYDTPARGSVELSGISFGLQAVDFTIGRIPNGSGPWRLTLPTPGAMNLVAALGPVSTLRLNEWLANPSGGDDDYLELYNPNPQPVELSGLHLSDDPQDPMRHRISDLSFIGTGLDGFALFIADDDADAGANHLGFALATSGETISLNRANGATIDTVTFLRQDNGVSEGRFPDGDAAITRFPGTTTPGRSNLRLLESIAINEVLSHTDPPFEDAIELLNVSQGYVDLSQWYLSDSRNDPQKFRLPDGIVLAPGAHVVFYEYQFNPERGVPPSFSLSSVRGDNVVLSTADRQDKLTGFQVSDDFGPALSGVSFGRYETSVDVQFVALTQRTFGQDNPGTIEQFRLGTGLTNTAPRVGPVVLSEIHYHPPEIDGTNDNVLEEFIELTNISATNTPLFHAAFPTNRWRLRDAVDFDFPAGTTLAPGASLLVVSFDPMTNTTALAAFQARFNPPAQTLILGPYDGKLDNSSDEIELEMPDEPQPMDSPDAGLVPYVLVEQVHYRDLGPWPALADGTGNSLQRRANGQFGNDPVNWQAGVPTPGGATGTPAATLPGITTQPVSRTINPGANTFFSVLASGTTPLRYQWRFNGKNLLNATNTTLTVLNAQNANVGQYRVLIYNSAGAVLSQTASLTLQSPPQIVKQPESRLAAAGDNVVFTVAANGASPLSFQWRKEFLDLPGEIHPVLRLPNVQISNEGRYDVVVRNGFGSQTSQVATLTILQPPVVTTSPQSQTVFVEDMVSFSVAATGTPPLRYRWTFNEAVLLNQTNSTLQIPSATLSDAGRYAVVVLNSVGSDTSQVAVLTVLIPPTVSIAASMPEAAEAGMIPGQFTITRSGSTNDALQVQYTLEGTASAGADYPVPPMPLLVPAGVTSVLLTIPIIDDPTPERTETVVATLAPGFGYKPEGQTNATITIADNDNQAPTITITNPAPGTVFTVPANVPIQTRVQDIDGAVVQVQFYANATNLLGVSTGPMFNFTWTNAPAGSNVLTAVVTDDLDAQGISDPVPIYVNAPPLAALNNPVAGSFFLAPANITLEASASDPGGNVVQVEFLEGNNVLYTDTDEPYRFDWLGVPENAYILRVRATDDRGAITFSTPVPISVGVAIPRFEDQFANRGLVLGFTNAVLGTNVTYTKEPGEPNHAGVAGEHSAWISWLAPASGLCHMDTFGSDFDTAMAVYTGNQLNGLVMVASNDDAPGIVSLQSQLSFTAVEGTLYLVAVTGYGRVDYGRIAFHQGMPNTGPVINAHPQSQTVDQGSTVSFTVNAMGPAPITFQWLHEGAPLSNATNSTLTVLNAQLANAGAYAVEVRNPGGMVTSLPAVLTVRVPPQILIHPQSQIVNAGQNVVLSVTATGTAPLTYVWRFNNVAISGATSSNLVFPSIGHTNGGTYRVSVGNSLGLALSLPVVISVRPRITNAQGSGAAGVQLNWLGTPRINYVVLAATNASQANAWTALGTVSNATINGSYLDATAPGQPARFYKLRQAP